MKLVLIVEDEPLIRDFDEDVLQEAGCETLTAATYDEVADLLAAGHKPDLALIDGNLSDGATGNKVARAIRNHAPDVRVVYTSANLDNDVRSNFVNATEVLPKPYTPEQLKEIVLDGLRRPVRRGSQTASITSIRKQTQFRR